MNRRFKFIEREFMIDPDLKIDSKDIKRIVNGRLNADMIFGLDKEYPSRVKVLSEESPSITIRMKENDKKPLYFINNLLNLIKELQNVEK